jgi:Fe-Mn family superoxide dismutase
MNQVSYFEKTRKMARENGLWHQTIEGLVKDLMRQGERMRPLLNQAAQAWNHAFMWLCMRPTTALLGKIDDETFVRTHLAAAARRNGMHTLASLRDTIKKVAAQHFGSGWTWVVLNNGSRAIEVFNTMNAVTPIASSEMVPLLTIDLWEHAYYCDRGIDRAGYVEGVVDNLLDWDFAEARVLGRA